MLSAPERRVALHLRVRLADDLRQFVQRQMFVGAAGNDADRFATQEHARPIPVRVFAAYNGELHLSRDEHGVDLLADLDDCLCMYERVTFLIASEDGRQTVHRVVDRHTDTQRAGDNALRVVEFLIHRCELTRDRPDVAQHNLTCGGELDAEARAQDKDDAKLLFELADAF